MTAARNDRAVQDASHPAVPHSEADKGVPPVGELPEPQEVDVWWGAYAGRAMLPSFAACTLWLVAVAFGAWFAWYRFDVDRLTARYWAFALIAVVWLLQLARWAYRTVTFEYRLTTRRLLFDRNFTRSGRAQIDLRDVSGVAVRRGLFDRRLGVGTVRVFARDPRVPTLSLRAVVDPDGVAEDLRRLVSVVREQGPVTTPEPDPATSPVVAGHREGEV